MIIKICNGKSCQDNFNSYVITRLKNDITRFDLKNVSVEEIPCMGMCIEGPIVKIDKEILKYATPIKASEMMFRKLRGEKPKKDKKRGDRKEVVEDNSFDENFIDKKTNEIVNNEII